MNLKRSRFYIIIQILISLIFILISYKYLQKKIELNYSETYYKSVQQLRTEADKLIAEKTRSTLSIGISLAQNSEIINAIKSKDFSKIDLEKYSLELRKYSNYKNVWIQVLDNKGTSFKRSWTDKKGDNLLEIRDDIQKMLESPNVMSTISVGKFDITFKTMIPIYEDSKFIGIFEIITHFNSIIKSLKKLNIDAVTIVDKNYKKQLTNSLTQLFIQDYYFADLEPNKDLLNILSYESIDELINQDYKIIKDKYLITTKVIKSAKDKNLGYIVLAKDINSLTVKDLGNIYIAIFIALIGYLLTILFVHMIFFSQSLSEVISLKDSGKLIFVIFIVFITLSLIMYYFLSLEKDSRINDYLDARKNDFTTQFKILYDDQKYLSGVIFDTVINKKNVLDILSHAYNEKNKDIARDNLFTILKDEYNSLKNYGVRQLHFHLRDNESFLRMHRPKKFGDNLTDIRSTVKYVNEKLQAVDSFEEGRIYNGFRFVYPIFNSDIKNRENHLGSVEISFNKDTYLNQFREHYAQNVDFLYYKKIVEKKVYQQERGVYSQSELKDFYLDKSSSNIQLDRFKDSVDFMELNKRIFEGKIFTHYISSVNKLLTIFPLENKITGDIVGAIITLNDDNYIKNKTNNFYFIFLSSILFFSMVSFFIYREKVAKDKIKEQNEKLYQEQKNTQKLLDIQEAIVILTNGEKLIRCNKSFLDFLGFLSLFQFTQKYDCICDLFIGDKEEYIQKNHNNQRWDEYILDNEDKINRVKILAKDGSEHIFKVNVNRLIEASNLKVATFYDITQLVILETKNKENEITLLEQSKMAQMGEMIGNIAHQWRQPLSAISTAASGMQLHKEFNTLDDAMFNELTSGIVTNTKYLSETIDTFRDFIREDKQKCEFDLNERIRYTVNLINDTLKNNFIELNFQAQNEITIINSIPSEVSQVFLNILNNAKDILVSRNIENPKIDIKIEQNDGHLTIIFEDNGRGVPKDIIDKIFDLYFTTKHQSQGTGIGLFMAKEIVKKHLHGDISVQNTDIGARFTVKLPKSI